MNDEVYRTTRIHFETFLESLFKDRENLGHSPLIEDEDGYLISPIVSHEREQLFKEINRIRKENKLDPVTKNQVSQADTLATGHIDFFSKLCTYSTELTIDGKLSPESYW